MHARAPVDVWRSVRSLPDFWRLLQVRVASQFGDGLFQAGLAGALLFNPDRAADPMAIAGAFAVLFLPYSLLGPFAGALMDRWDRRWVLVGANTGRLALIAGVGTILAVGAGDVPLLVGALVANGLARFVASGLSAALPHVVPREQVVTMNSVAIASGRSPRSWAPTSCCCLVGFSAAATRGPPRSSSWWRSPYRSRCFGRCGSARGYSARTTPNARSTDLLSTPWSPVGYMERAPWCNFRPSLPACPVWQRIGWWSVSTHC